MPNFDWLYKPGELILTDFGSGPVEHTLLGKLTIKSGNLLVFDPMHLSFAGEPLLTGLADGDYPVLVASAGKDGNVCAAFLSILDTEPLHWTCGDCTLSVDSGLGCFVDADIAKLEESALEEVSLTAGQVDRASLVQPDGINVNMAVFFTGYGDGEYGCYKGIDNQGNTACVLVDFNIAIPIGPQRLKAVLITRLDQKLNTQLSDPELVAAGLSVAIRAEDNGCVFTISANSPNLRVLRVVLDNNGFAQDAVLIQDDGIGTRKYRCIARIFEKSNLQVVFTRTGSD